VRSVRSSSSYWCSDRFSLLSDHPCRGIHSRHVPAHRAVTAFTNVSQLVEYLVALIGLGIAIDYSLLVITRWREERDRGRTNDEAVVVAMATAGRAVAFSGITVGVGLLTLVLLPVPFLRSLGYGGLLIPVVTVIAAIRYCQ